MDRYRLKNIIILILALVNLFLLGSIIQRHNAQISSHQNAVEQLCELFEADGVELLPERIPSKQPPESLSLSRSSELEEKAAALLLGSTYQETDQGGGILTCTSERGTALFRANGSFEASGTLGTKDSLAFSREFCHRFGYSKPEFQLDKAGNGSGEALRLWDGLPIFNSSIRFTFTQGQLTQIEGILLSENATPLPPEVEPLSALAALTRFQQARKETGAVVNAITDISLCYELQSSTSLPISLVPAWCIDSNTVKYYVNAVTGVVHLP